MSGIVRWEPFREITSLRDAMDRMFEEGFWRPPGPFGGWGEGTLALDMYETEDSVVVKTAIPGMKAEDLDVSVTGNTLTIRAETTEEEEIKRERYLRRERRHGSYARSVTLPNGLQADRAEADYTDGVLTLTFPKAEEVRPKTIKVKGQQ
ncbi:MAG: Hsp20/alpha crystallin family protein [Anaerolineae bacterium]|jgi:HSP20 family protein|nr:Hsp20/alpha crystallin family protein [Anaerolineae bacterium]MDX9831251.1 Hsp20/alpha crystallin family protein [Anaerolineae bacterium]